MSYDEMSRRELMEEIVTLERRLAEAKDKLFQLNYVENSDIFEKDVSLEPTDYIIVEKARLAETRKQIEELQRECDKFERQVLCMETEKP